MLLTISTTHTPATDLGYLLYKNPAKPQAFELSFGTAHVFYPHASEQQCTAALMLDVDPVGLVRNRRGPSGEAFSLEQYVNDRPYVASSLMSVAIAQVFGTALSGKSRDRPELAQTAIPLAARIDVLPCRGGEAFLRRLFEPLGYHVTAQSYMLDEQFPEWGQSPYFSVELSHTTTLHDLLTHLYVLMPVLDDDKHYWVGDEEVEKLLRHGKQWLGDHPEREQIVSRYLKHRKHLAESALARLLEEDQQHIDDTADASAAQEDQVEKPLSLNEHRLEAVISALRESAAKSVLDLGCSTGNLLQRLIDDSQFQRIVGLDVSHRALKRAAERLHLDRMPEAKKQRIHLVHGSLTYRDKRLTGFDAAAIVEVIEHLDPPRLAAFERVVFESARPKLVVLTTPNVEYNVKFETLPAGAFRHRDHRFEWTRLQFETWARSTAIRFGYTVRFLPVGPQDSVVGSPTQMGVFEL